MENLVTLLNFYKGKRVFITGHSGFKGSWLCRILARAGAEVTGYSLGAPTDPALFDILDLSKCVRSINGDILDYEHLFRSFSASQPEIVLHLAAQPIVRESYHSPRATFETNVMGTVNLLECTRLNHCVRSFLNVTTDKVYFNPPEMIQKRPHGFPEDDPLNGADPYSNSKSCSELVTASYRASFFKDREPAISTARAGNVIGGGDFAADRILPDCARFLSKGKTINVRNPHSIRPYQHVLEPLFAYLLIAKSQWEDPSLADSYNVGPDESNCVSTGELTNLFCSVWGSDARWEHHSEAKAHKEADFLKLDASHLKKTLNWHPVWDIQTAVQLTAEWYRAYFNNENDISMIDMMDQQIERYIADTK